MFKLVIQDDEGKTTVVPLIRDEITIGRKEGNTIRLTERNVSRRHARIVRNNGEVQIEDLGSYNGIRVNNARIAERVSLRISDQVQIGDYKLYLKAEGVEQVDDARTMPIERVDTNTATDVIPAIAAPSTATMPTASPATNGLASAPGTPQLIGNPARTMVAIADTDPAGRPVATAATVAALSQSVGYGKLVVLSSNFAGKEFELSRPQMIIGRTDENDICINHRSISRNHAKLVREPETGRYTISDLQSSNGVRVNGQDYGKVELRRGDVVDLGHVRLRFVEPGEDFVFARDAVITDVPDGGKKGMLIAVILGVLVLGAVIVFFVVRGDKPNGGNGSNGMAAIPDAAEKVAVNNPGSNDGSSDPIGSNDGSDIEPTITPDAPEAGSAATNPVGSNPPVANSELEQKCLDFQKAQKWSDLQTCANTMQATNPKRAAELGKRAENEAKAFTQSDKVTEAVAQENLDAAYAAMIKIPKDSVYYQDAKRKFDMFESKVLTEFRNKVRAAAADKNCKNVDQLVRQAPSRIQPELKKIQCEDRVATGSNNTTNPPAGCQPGQAEGFYEAARTAYGAGQWASAISNVDKAIACGSPKPDYYQMGGYAACSSGNAAKAKSYFNRLSGSKQNAVLVKCAGNKITLP